MKYIKAAWFWLYFPLLTLACFTFLALLRPFYWLLRRPMDRLTHKTASVWSRIILALMPGWRVKLTGLENLPQAGEPAIVVANHLSAADIWVIYALGFQFRWIAKDAVFKIPAIGLPMRWAGYIPVTRGNKDSHRLAMMAAAERLQSGVCMFFFPEGTRSETGEMRPFKIGAFKLSGDLKAPIIPIALQGTRDLVPKGAAIPGSATVHVQVLPKEYRHGNEDFEDYAKRVRGIIAQALN